MPEGIELAPQQGFNSDGESFAKLIQFLKKRSWLVAVGIMAGIAVASTINSLSHRLYTAAAQVEIVPDLSGEFRLEQSPDMGGFSDDAEKLDTETQILVSRTLALQTINSLHLDRNPDFLPFPKGRPWDMSSPSVRAA